MGLFGFERNTGKVFMQYYEKMLKLINSIEEAQNGDFELLPAMFVVCDIAALSAKNSRQKIANSILTEICALNNGFDPDEFDSRVNLYSDIVNGKKLRGEWIAFNTEAWNKDPIMRITVLLGDILYNPACADNYDGAPVMIRGITNMALFSQGMEPILYEMVELFKRIHKLKISE